jgi:hypothetical protein
MLAAGRSSHAAARVIGLPLATSLPNIKGIRWRFCSRWDEQPAAHLAKSLLRLGICRADDWSGSAVDFVERGFRRFARANGAEQALKVWSGELRIADDLLQLSEVERNQQNADAEGPATTLYLVGEYHAAASIPISATLLHLEKIDPRLPAAFYHVLVHNLGKWMRVYDYSDAVEQSELWLSELDEEDEGSSIYRRVKENIPSCLARHVRLSKSKARKILHDIARSPQRSISRQLVHLVLELDELGKGYDHAWAGKLVKDIPEIEDWLAGCDGCGPGCLISWHEDDEINGCFDEEMRCIGQEGPFEPPIVLAMKLGRSIKEGDAVVKKAMDHASAMLRSLATAAGIVQIIREIDDENIRQHRLQPGLQIEPGAAGVRDQQL